MKGLLSLTIAASAAVGALASLQIDVTLPVECDRKTQKGDVIDVHYSGTLASDGSKFDASYDRGTPLSFPLGGGRVIKGCVKTPEPLSSLPLVTTATHSWDEMPLGRRVILNGS
jgi:hypothetical protein